MNNVENKVQFGLKDNFLSIETKNDLFNLFLDKLDIFETIEDKKISLVSTNQLEEFIELFDYIKDQSLTLNLEYELSEELKLLLLEKASTDINL